MLSAITKLLMIRFLAQHFSFS